MVTLWNPSNDDNINAWFDSSDLSTITESEGLISEWRSKVNSYKLLQEQSSYSPLLTEDGVKFEGDFFDLNSNIESMEIFAVVETFILTAPVSIAGMSS